MKDTEVKAWDNQEEMQSNHISHFWSTQLYCMWTDHLEWEASRPWLQHMATARTSPMCAAGVQQQFSSRGRQNQMRVSLLIGRCLCWGGDRDDNSAVSHHLITEKANKASKQLLMQTAWPQHAERELFLNSLMTLPNLCKLEDFVLFFT